MKLELPDDILRVAETTAKELRLALAIELYADRRIDHAAACRLAETVPAVLNRELVRRNLSVQAYPEIAPWRTRAAG